MKSVWKSEIISGVSGGIVVLASSGPGVSRDPLTKLGGSLRAAIGQIHHLTCWERDSYLILCGVVSSQITPRSRFQSALNHRFFYSEKLPKGAANTKTARTPRFCAGRPGGLLGAPCQPRGYAARWWYNNKCRTSAPPVTARL